MRTGESQFFPDVGALPIVKYGGSFKYRGVVLGWRVWDMELSHIFPDSYGNKKNSVMVRLWSGEICGIGTGGKFEFL